MNNSDILDVDHDNCMRFLQSDDMRYLRAHDLKIFAAKEFFRANRIVLWKAVTSMEFVEQMLPMCG